LRGHQPGAFLLESVEHGRLGRHSLVGAGSRVVSFDEAEALGVPVVGYLGYDHVAKLEPTVPLPDRGRALPESRFVVADTLVRFDHGSGTAAVLAGDPTSVSEALSGSQPAAEPPPSAATTSLASASPSLCGWSASSSRSASPTSHTSFRRSPASCTRA